MFKTRQVNRLREEKEALVLRCASDRVGLAIECEAFRDATRWANLLADGVALIGPKLSAAAPALLGVAAARSAGLAGPKLVRLGKMALVGWKLARSGWAMWKRWQTRRVLAAVR
ncbi:MAG: hypothetical protein OHK005_15330 [Candidatus Methylacidiphilales bacterium]